jgi:hypothetical protein
MSTVSKRWVRLAGLLIGCGLSIGFLLSTRLPQNGVSPPASLRVDFGSTDELLVSPRGRFLSTHDLKPGVFGRDAFSTAAVTNPTDTTLAVRLRARPSIRDLDDLLQVAVAVGGKPLLRRSLGELHAWSEQRFNLAGGERNALELRVWLPRSVRDGYQARTANVSLQLRADPLGEA